MVRRTVSIPDYVDALISAHRREGESYSATLVRLLTGQDQPADRPEYVGSGRGPGDLGINAEKYLTELVEFD